MSPLQPQGFDPSLRRLPEPAAKRGPGEVVPPDQGQAGKKPTGGVGESWIDTVIAKADQIANRTFLEGDYIPGPIRGTDVRDRSPDHPPT